MTVDTAGRSPRTRPNQTQPHSTGSVVEPKPVSMSNHPDDILTDETLDDRTVSGESDMLRVVVSLGRLTRGHALIMPNPHGRQVESIATLLLRVMPSSVVEEAIRLTHQARVQGIGPGYQVLFEHGNSGDPSSSRFGTRVAHLHSVWTSNRNAFTNLLENYLARHQGWERIEGWRSLPEAVGDRYEYCFIQASPEDAWYRIVLDPNELPIQYPRRIIHAVLNETDRATTPPSWVWRSADDLDAAEEDAIAMRSHFGQRHSGQSSITTPRVTSRVSRR